MLINKTCILFTFFLVLSLVFTIAKAQNRSKAFDSHEGQLPTLPVNSTSVKSLQSDTLPIIAVPQDTLSIPKDSISTAQDSTSSNAIDAPVDYSAKDSIVMSMDGSNLIRLYGEAVVKYKNLELSGEYIEIDADKSMVYATFALDSTRQEFGYPIFKEGESQYEMKQMWYNFKTKKGFIKDVITEQGEGFVTAGQTKKMDNDDLFMVNGKYTTCDDHDHPHFYLNLTKAKVQPGKRIVTGPAYLVLEDVPLPIFIPFGFFPFTSEYSSGVIMPTYGDEVKRGFSLRDGGYYFAINDHIDLALTGEIYTKGSWGLAARSTYRTRYKFSGGFNTSYLVTITGDKGSSDYMKSNDFKLAWTHSQDPKSNPYSTFSAGVNFSTTSYNQNDLYSASTSSAYQNTKSSSINYTLRIPNSPFSISANASVNQIAKDTTLSMTLPNMTISMNEIYPFRRKEQIGDPRWYEAIRVRYTGIFMNSIPSTKEYEFFKKNLIKDWNNGMKHDIPVSASFNLMKYINITPNVNYTSRWYTKKVDQEYDNANKRLVPTETEYGFYRVYDYNGGVSMNTKLYGFYKPWSLLGKWAKGSLIRHVMTPSASFSGAPDFSSTKFGYYKDLYYYNPDLQRMDTLNYSPFQTGLWGAPAKGRTGTMSFSLDNNIEMKVQGQDTVKKYSIIDNLGLNMSYNFLADSMKWSNMNASLRLKLSKSFTLNLNGVFDTYTYNEKGQRIDVPRWEAGKGLGRLMTTGTSFSYTLNNDVLKKWFGKGDKSNEATGNNLSDSNIDSDEQDVLPEDAVAEEKPASLRTRKKSDGEFDSDSYLIMNIPWNLSFNYSMNLNYDLRTDESHNYTNFNPVTKEFGYRITQTLGFSGNITPTKGWSFNFNTSYDFDYNKFAYMQCSITRNLHCWQMSASIVPLGPYQMYSFTISVSSSLLKDLKYTQSSNYRDSQSWY